MNSWGKYTMQRKNHQRSYIDHCQGIRIGFCINLNIMGLENKFHSNRQLPRETIELIQFQTIISSQQITTCQVWQDSNL
ncbi:hypothetical protein EUGRSUZ_F01526 [Eucalyptus grandis]|uniref:Uncharacterized protein n=2 Tax=Eucalyptus grandis TaxID=71139 RepID=A0ACC3KFG2_EUCGR|nr:hypothetical protein EUGRSUZ_F01526 [Eucalyptus grandis]